MCTQRRQPWTRSGLPTPGCEILRLAKVQCSHMLERLIGLHTLVNICTNLCTALGKTLRVHTRCHLSQVFFPVYCFWQGFADSHKMPSITRAQCLAAQHDAAIFSASRPSTRTAASNGCQACALRAQAACCTTAASHHLITSARAADAAGGGACCWSPEGVMLTTIKRIVQTWLGPIFLRSDTL